MNPSLNLLDRLLTQARHLLVLGRRLEARRRLEKLLAFPDVPVTERIEARRLLADLQIDNQNYRKARRHLTAALGLDPESAELHYQLGTALDLDPDVEPKRAAKYFRKALELKPDEARYWSAYGQVCLRVGRERAAYGAFVAAADLAPNQVEVIDEIVDGFCFLGRHDDARATLMAARFRLGHSTELEQLWNRFRFLMARDKQQSLRRREALARGEAVVLPFKLSVEPVEPKQTEGGILRHDRLSRPAPHTRRQNSDSKRVP
jgi:tetratricopeptide (TPR) repeat protein